jgi:hypothetical protein
MAGAGARRGPWHWLPERVRPDGIIYFQSTVTLTGDRGSKPACGWYQTRSAAQTPAIMKKNVTAVVMVLVMTNPLVLARNAPD